ncbi:transporter, SSS family [Dyadobacter sp. SG02]|uniref:sodium:solute symporter family transporter n=1 Tax=Dyadobacter sp. SG02 TaxID=1855291 RepID=UPI0008B776EA|nr:sodium/solute symporter [Dyadobacter sp. SG02]SEI58911.1 transporter, SSS family [Dyadobacter sp. SG02]
MTRFLFFLTIFLKTMISNAQPPGPSPLQWKSLPPLPDAVGFAGSYAGVSNNALIVAGGANFPGNAGPWGTAPKTWYDDIFVLENPSGSWKKVGKLPHAMGYGVSLTTPQGIFCLGGADGTRHYNQAFYLNWKDGRISTTNLPALPLPLAYASGALLGDKAYIAGGTSAPSDTNALNRFWEFDLLKKQWNELPPVPGNGRMLAVAGAQDGRFFLFSGVELHHNAATGTTQRTYLKECLAYNPVSKTWKRIADLPNAVAAAPSPAYAAGQSHLLVVGGDDGTNAQRVMELREKHPGFRNEIMAYHSITDTWAPLGTFTGGQAAVTAPLVNWEGRLVIPSGEIQPGIRTPRVVTGTPVVNTGTFNGIDWGVVSVYFLLVLGISIYVSRKMGASTDDFFLGGQNIPWWAAGLSIFGSKLSALTFIAIPAKTYATDWVYIFANAMIVVVAPIVIWFFLPYFRKLKITSVYEYLAFRFNKTVKLVGSFTFVVFQVGRLGIVIYLPALVLSTVTGMNLMLCIILTSLITTAYTISGGIEAVVWTEVMQVGVLLGGAFVSLFFIANASGGFDSLFRQAGDAGKFHMVNNGWAITEPVLWVVLVGNFLTQIVTYTSDQVVVQRYLTTPTEAEARRSIWTNAFLVIPATLIFFLVGTALWVYFKQAPQLLNPMARTDDIFPWFISTQLPAGLRGLVIAGLFAATMSTISSSMNSIATVVTTDFFQHFVPKSTDLQRFRFARYTTLALGAAGIGIAIWLVFMENNSIWDQYLKLIGIFGGCLAGMFVAGIFFPSINSTGILVGFFISAVLLYFVQAHGWLHFFLYPGVGIFGCVIFGWLVSKLLPVTQRA